MADVLLQAGSLSLSLRPSWGGRVVSFSHEIGGDVLLPVAETTFHPDNWPRAGAYPLVPFHNRVAGARCQFGGREAHLSPHPSSLPHALHGMGSRLPWTPGARSGEMAQLLLRRPGDRIWPWSFEARQVFHLDPGGLTVTLHLANVDDVPMPGGLGWHPYFPRPISIRDTASVGWPVQDDYLPGSGPVSRDTLKGHTLYLAHWSSVVLDLPGGPCLRMRDPVGLPHLVIHQPPGPFACVEPVSHLANALTQPGIPDMGPIAPGDTMTSRFRLDVTLEPLPAANGRHDRTTAHGQGLPGAACDAPT